MALPLGALVTSSLLLFLVAFPLPDVHAAHNIVVGGTRNKQLITPPKHNHPKFAPGPWKQAHATFYEGGSGTFGIYIHNYLYNI